MVDYYTQQRRRFIAGNLLQRIWRYLTQPKPDVMDRITLIEARTLDRKRRAATKALGENWVLAKDSKFDRGWKP